MNNEDIVRKLNQVMDVLTQVQQMMYSEATMNALKHMSSDVRPVPLYSAVVIAKDELTLLSKYLETK